MAFDVGVHGEAGDASSALGFHSMVADFLNFLVFVFSLGPGSRFRA